MKLFFLILLFPSLLVGLISEGDNHGDIVLKFGKLKNKKGKILISIFNSADGFPENEKKAYKSWVEDPKDEIVLKDIPAGNYALTLLHDEDANFKMTYNLFQYPKEQFAFSNIKSMVLKIPSFEKTRFLHKKEGTILEIKMLN